MENVLMFVPIGIVLLVLIVIASGYVKASPDKAYIISGIRKTPKILIGKAGIKIPFFEKKDELNLQLIPIDVKTSTSVPTADYININVDAAVNVKISDDMIQPWLNPKGKIATYEELEGKSSKELEQLGFKKGKSKLALATQNFLNKKTEYIGNVAREVLEGNMREIVGQMRLEEMVSDRQKFAEMVKKNAEPDLAEMGLDIVSFNVQNFTDKEHVIENLGVDNVVKISKNAAISRANAEKEIAVAQANANKESNDARVEAETTIATRNNELRIKQAELKKESDIKQAEADAAYEIQKEEQRKTIEITSANANIAKQEREIELKRKEAEVKEQALDAEVKKQAEAEKFARIQKADADLYERQKRAEAERFEKEKAADAKKLQAEADKFSKVQEAEGIRAVGEAEAAAIAAKGIADAEATEKKAEAMKKYGQAAMMEMVVKALPEMAKAIAEPMSTIDKVTIIGGANDNGVSSMSNNVGAVLAKTFETVKETTGFDMAEIMRAQTYDAKVTRNVNVTGLENASDVVKGAVAKSVVDEVETSKDVE